jgi:hypothetical protein
MPPQCGSKRAMLLSYRPIPRRNKLQAPHSVPAPT